MRGRERERERETKQNTFVKQSVSVDGQINLTLISNWVSIGHYKFKEEGKVKQSCMQYEFLVSAKLANLQLAGARYYFTNSYGHGIWQ